jgi:hypothetical protein
MENDLKSVREGASENMLDQAPPWTVGLSGVGINET